MCGACGRPHDPDGAAVAGPRRRAAVAAAASGPGRRVRAVPGGWTVAGPTGRTAVARTLAELLDALGPPDRAAARRALLAAAAGR